MRSEGLKSQSRQIPGGHDVVVVDHFREGFQPRALGNGLLRRLLDHLHQDT
jgi:hypothetical protein